MSQRRARIMAIDDEVAVLKSLTRLLSREHDLRTTPSSLEALALLEKGERFDVILCDRRMPELDGLELHERIAAFAPDQAARMVFVTASAYEESTQTFMARTGNECLAKPVAAADLRAAIAKVLARGER